MKQDKGPSRRRVLAALGGAGVLGALATSATGQSSPTILELGGGDMADDAIANRVKVYGGPVSERPAAGVQGRYWVADSGDVYEDIGTQWERVERRYELVGSRRLQSEGAAFDWVVHEGSDGQWYADGPDDGTSSADVETALQYAFDNASTGVKLKDGVGSATGEYLTTTVTIPSGVDFIGPGNRGTSAVYADVSPGFRKEGLGTVRDLFMRGDHDDVAGAYGDNTLFFWHEGGRGSLMDNCTFSRTTDSGLVSAGCQQMTFQNISSSACGSSTFTGGIKLRDNDVGDLGTNACEFVNLHFHGSAEQGPWITSQDVNGGGAGLVNRFSNINGENGPPSQPLFYIAGMRDSTFSGVHAMGIDSDVSAVWRLTAGPPRCTFNDITVVGDPTYVWHVTGEGITVDGAIIDTTAIVLYDDNYGQVTEAHSLSDVKNPAGGTFCDLVGFGDLEMDNVQTNGQLDTNRGDIFLDNCSIGGVVGANQSDNHAKLRKSDERDGLLTFAGVSTDGSGDLICDIAGRDVKINSTDVMVDSLTYTATGAFTPSYTEVSKNDNDLDGDTDEVVVRVFDDTGATPGAGVVTADLRLVAI